MADNMPQPPNVPELAKFLAAVVLCDLLMPDKSGMDIYEGVRARDPALLERFVFMTGGAFTREAARFLATVPNVTLQKPFDVETVRSALDRVWRNR
jgi:DNA-binding NarL/FixJ family response regulator